MDLKTMLSETYLGNTGEQWVWAAGIFLGTLILCWLGVVAISRGLHRLATKTATHWDDIAAAVVSSTNKILLVFVATFAASHSLTLPSLATQAVRIAAVFAVVIQIGIWANRALAEWMQVQRAKKDGEAETLTFLSGAEWVGKIVIWLVVLLAGLENLGVDVTGLAAGLGIGGIAIALAVQNILGDLFGAFSIYLDKPFVLGDFLTVDTYSGTVEKIGIKSTRIRSLTGEQLIFSNSDLLASRIRNYGRMAERRGSFTLALTYETSAETMAKIPGFIREVIEARPNTRFDRSHFKDFGDSSLNVETVYYMLVPDYQSLMDTQQGINLEILKRFNEEGIEFAFPTQTVHLATDPDQPST